MLLGSRRDPRRAVEDGRLERALYAELSPSTLFIPPLRERAEDIPLLAHSFLDTIVEINRLPPIRFSAEALGLLQGYSWPGNVQELRNAVEHAAILATDGIVGPHDLPDRVRDAPDEHGAAAGSPRRLTARRFRDVKREVVESFERAYLCDLMEQHGGNVTSASQQAGMLRSALQRLLRKYGLKSAEFRRRRRAPKPSEAQHPRVD